MRFILDTNILIPLEDSQCQLSDSLANFIRLANNYGHVLLYHPATISDIEEDKNEERRKQTLQRLKQYECLEAITECAWNDGVEKRNDIADNEILYAIASSAAHGLVTEDKGIHSKAKERGLIERVYTIQTAEDLLRRLHEKSTISLPNIENVSLYQLTSLLNKSFFDSLREGYPGFNNWFESKAQEGRKAWVCWEKKDSLAGICIFTHQKDESITDSLTLEGEALKLSTFKVADLSRGKKIGELFLKAAFKYATINKLEYIFIHGDRNKHHFLFEMLCDYGFYHVGDHPGSRGKDVVYLKNHPILPPNSELLPFEYMRMYYPHYKDSDEVSKFIVPIKPEFHRTLFPDYLSVLNRQIDFLVPENTAGNAIKQAYLCHAQTQKIDQGDIVLFYRSGDDRALTSIGVVESYDTFDNVDEIVSKVKRRTVYTINEIRDLAKKPTRVMLFRIIRHFDSPIEIGELIRSRVLKGTPRSITKISNEKYRNIIS